MRFIFAQIQWAQEQCLPRAIHNIWGIINKMNKLIDTGDSEVQSYIAAMRDTVWHYLDSNYKDKNRF